MTTQITSKIVGAFTGFHGSAIFRLTNGQVWQQRHYKYKYRYRYRPDVKIYERSGKYMLEVEGMSEQVEVVRVSIKDEGTIVTKFKGFSPDAIFQFQSGHVYVPAEYKYMYQYAYRPSALVVNGINGLELHVDGMNETLRVRRK